MYSYVDAIVGGFPGIDVHTLGDPFDYSTLIVGGEDTLPSQADLDSWIISQERADAWTAIQALRSSYSNGGVKLSGNAWFQTDDTSRIQYLAMVMLGANLPSTIMWKKMDSTFVQMTPTLVQQVFGALIGADQVIFAHAEVLRAGMNAATDPTTYDITTGWPQSYAEYAALQ